MRKRLPPLAAGRVLEIGAGARLNFSFYGEAVRHLFALEPADYLRAAAAAAAETAAFPVTLIGSGAEEIPLESGSMDTIVSTWSLCSIPDISSALLEMRRVLRADGRLIFMQHGRAPEPDIGRQQARLARVFRALAGCDPNRPMAELIAGAGFRITSMDASYLEGPRFIAYHYIGEARPG